MGYVLSVTWLSPGCLVTWLSVTWLSWADGRTVSAFLLDTNVISELIKPKPEPKVTAWIDDTDEELLFLSGRLRKWVPRSNSNQ
jgi:hypothetical protein